MPSRRLIAIFVCFLVVAPIATGFSQVPSINLMDYHDHDEIRDRLIELHKASENVRGFKIGISIDYTVNPVVTHSILAIRISGNGPTDRRIVDKGDSRPAILFDAGLNPREWLSTECLVELAEYLVEQCEDPNSRVSQALQHVDIWILPLSNPAGRSIDDQQSGNPTKYFTSDAPQTKNGWRGNGDIRTGKHGVDLARNFSVDWAKANSEPNGSYWRGIAPFSSTEATALRQFVQNHSIAMAVHLHTTSQVIGPAWGEGDRVGVLMRKQAAAVWLEGASQTVQRYGKTLETSKLAFSEGVFGTTIGQFPAWLTKASDTPDDPDFGSIRAIPTVCIELPFDQLRHGNYYGGIFQHAERDGSNSFHPSGSTVRELIRDAFIPMAVYLIEQASAPCAVTKRYNLKPNNLETDHEPGTLESELSVLGDLGILAAKIAVDNGAPGAVRSYPAWQQLDGINMLRHPARDYVKSGRHYVCFWVQNYSSITQNARVGIRVESRPIGRDAPWREAFSTIRPVRSLAALEKRFDQVRISVGGRDEYKVSIEIQGANDAFPKNNRKVFRFTGTSALPTPQHGRLGP
jgi:hypothetical protein